MEWQHFSLLKVYAKHCQRANTTPHHEWWISSFSKTGNYHDTSVLLPRPAVIRYSLRWVLSLFLSGLNEVDVGLVWCWLSCWLMMLLTMQCRVGGGWWRASVWPHHTWNVNYSTSLAPDMKISIKVSASLKQQHWLLAWYPRGRRGRSGERNTEPNCLVKIDNKNVIVVSLVHMFSLFIL